MRGDGPGNRSTPAKLAEALEIARTDGLRAAAAHAGITEPSMARHIAKAETAALAEPINLDEMRSAMAAMNQHNAALVLDGVPRALAIGEKLSAELMHPERLAAMSDKNLISAWSTATSYVRVMAQAATLLQQSANLLSGGPTSIVRTEDKTVITDSEGVEVSVTADQLQAIRRLIEVRGLPIDATAQAVDTTEQDP